MHNIWYEICQRLGHEFRYCDFWADPCYNLKIETGFDIVGRFFTYGYDTLGNSYFFGGWSMLICH